MTTIRAGVVGPGSIGINHARIYSELPDCELTAIYDANKANAVKVAARYGGKPCDTLE
jgi:predicted dehydrogenase